MVGVACLQKTCQLVGWKHWILCQQTMDSGDRVIIFCRIRMIEKHAFVWLRFVSCVGHHSILFFSRVKFLTTLHINYLHYDE